MDLMILKNHLLKRIKNCIKLLSHHSMDKEREDLAFADCWLYVRRGFVDLVKP